MKSGKSFIQLQVKTQGLQGAINSALKMQSLARRKKHIENGAKDALTVIKGHYNQGRFLWLNTALPTHGRGRKVSQWWRETETGWFLKSVTSARATVENDAKGLSHKITGGTIRAKRKKFLTIPIDPRAHGISAGTFQTDIAPLFRIKNVLAMKEKNGEITPIYALKKSVTHKPWPNALPPESEYVNAFVGGVLDSILLDFES